MKSPHRTHYSRVDVRAVAVTQEEDDFTVTVTFRFDPWDMPAIYPVGYAADAAAAVDAVIESGFHALQQAEQDSVKAEGFMDFPDVAGSRTGGARDDYRAGYQAAIADALSCFKLDDAYAAVKELGATGREQLEEPAKRPDERRPRPAWQGGEYD